MANVQPPNNEDGFMSGMTREEHKQLLTDVDDAYLLQHRGESSLSLQRDGYFQELKRAQAIIDGLRSYRELVITCPFETTPQMRARIKELATPARDDFDRAVLMLLEDFNRLVSRANEPNDPGDGLGIWRHNL